MTNPTTPQPVQEPAGAVEALRALVENEGLEAFAYLDKGIGTATASGKRWLAARRALASLQPVTQAKSEAVAWQVKQKAYKDRGPWVDVDRVTYESASKYPERCEVRALVPQEAVERQPLTGWISVDERLPEENMPVLVTKDGGHEYIDLDVMEEGVWRDWCEYVEHVEVIGGRTSDVKLYTHWAPIPCGIGPATQERTNG
jgi:hypothetical protein